MLAEVVAALALLGLGALVVRAAAVQREHLMTHRLVLLVQLIGVAAVVAMATAQQAAQVVLV
jgi:hypothetical protein